MGRLRSPPSHKSSAHISQPASARWPGVGHPNEHTTKTREAPQQQQHRDPIRSRTHTTHSTPRQPRRRVGDCSLPALVPFSTGDGACGAPATNQLACLRCCLLCAHASRSASDGGNWRMRDGPRVNRNLTPFALVFLGACFLACDVRWSGKASHAAAWICGKGATSVSSHCLFRG